MAPASASTRSLTRDDWLQAASSAMADNGVRGIAVEPLAKSLRATKGSFYWHFRDREDLIRAVLERWERQETQGVIEGLESISDPRERLRQLLLEIHRRLSRRPDASVALTGDTASAARSALERVTARRVRFVGEQLEAFGIAADEAARRALLAYASYLGFATLARSAPGVLPTEDALIAYVETVLNALVGEAP